MADPQFDPEELAQHLDEVLPPGQESGPAALAASDDPLVNAALRLSLAPRPQMPPDVMARIEAQVVAAARQQTLSASRYRPPQRSWPARLARLAAVAAAVVLVFVVGLGPVMAASLPGDVLYPAKRAVERVELSLAGSPQAEALTRLTHAERRVDEATRLLSRQEFRPELVTAALDEMTLAAALARQTDDPIGAESQENLLARSVELVGQLEDLLAQVEHGGWGAAELHGAINQARDSGTLLLPPTPTPTAAPSPTPPATQALTPTATLTTTATPAASASPSTSPTPSPTATTAPAELDASPPGQSNEDGGEYNCDNPPPDNAPALGWREHCEGAPRPNTNAPGQNNPRGNSGSNGRGNSDRK